MTVADINQDGRLEIIAIDISANVMCLTPEGELLWETQITGTATAGSRVADINQDGKMELIIASSDGYAIWLIIF